MMRWDGSRKGIEVLCRWANDGADGLDDPFVTYEFTDSGGVGRVLVATDDGDFTELRAWDWLVQTEEGFGVERADGFSTDEKPNPRSVRPTGMCGSPLKCDRCPSAFLCYTKAGDEKDLIKLSVKLRPPTTSE